MRTIKKNSNLLPRFFKTFVIYLMMTMSVFFGYVVLFGDVKPEEIKLPTDDTDASDETLFGGLVESFSNFKNIDTDFELTFENDQLKIEVGGNVAVDLSSGNIALNDIDLNYNNDHFLISAVYVNPYLYLSVDQGAGVSALADSSVKENKTFYKFDLISTGSSSIDFSQILDFVMENVEIDLSFIDEIESYIGIDFENFNPNDLLAKLKIDEKQRENGEIVFNISLNSISAQIVCESNFEIKSVELAPLLLKNNSVTFSAGVNDMNAEDFSVDFEEDSSNIDMTQINKYVSFAESLFANKFVAGDVDIELDGKLYEAKLLINNEDEMQFMLKTSVEGVDISLAFANDEVYLSLADVNVKFAIKDYLTWKTVLDELFVKHTNKTVAEYFEALIEAYVNIDVENVDWQQELLAILGAGFANAELLQEYLPNATQTTTNSFKMLWNNGLKIGLYAESELLSAVDVEFDGLTAQVEFGVLEKGFVIEGEHYDISTLLPLAGVVDSILETNQFGGKMEVEVGGKVVVADYFVDFNDSIFVQVEMNVFGEDVLVAFDDENVFVCVGEVVVSGEISKIEEYLNQIDAIFGTNLSKLIAEQNVGADDAIGVVLGALKELSIESEQGKIAIIQCLSMLGEVSLLDDNGAKIDIQYNDLRGSIEVFATSNVVEKLVATDSVENVIAKVGDVLEFAMSKQYAFGFSANYYDAEMTYITLSGEARIDLINGIYEIKGLEIGNNTLNVVYADGVVYVDYAENKLKVKVENVLDVVKVVMPIVNANLGDADAEESSAEGSVKVDVDMVMELLSEACGEDVSAMTIEELVGKLTVELTGSLDNLGLGVILNTTNAIGANVGVEFTENELSKISVNVQDMVDLTLNVKEFEDIAVVASAYYDLTSKHSGQVTLTYTKDEEEKALVADIDLDITNGVYVRIATVVMGETVEVVVSGAEAYVVIGDVVLAFDLKETKTLINEVMALLGEEQVSTTMIETEQNEPLALTLEAIGELLRTIDLNGIDPTSIAGLTWSLTDGEELSADYAVNDKLTVSVKLSDEKTFNNVVPTANASVEDTIAKVNNVRAFAMSKQYAFGFSANYYDAETSYITLSGEARVDLINGIYEIKGLEIGNNTLNVVYAGGVVYIDYADNKLKVKVENVLDVVKVVMPIVNANLGDADAEEGSAEGSVNVDVDMAMELLNEACGEDVSAMTIEELVGKLTVELTGSLDNLGLGVILNTTNVIGANVGVEFAENELSKISVNVQDMVDLTLNVKEFEDIGFVASEYYDLTSKHSGQVTLTYTKDEEEKTLVADIDLDITNGVYVRIATVVMGETVEVVVSGAEAYVVIGEVVLTFDLKETRSLVNEVMALLEMNVAEGANVAEDTQQNEPLALTLEAIGELLRTIDLNGIDPTSIAGLTWSLTDGEELSAEYTVNENLTVSVKLGDEKSFNNVVPTANASVEDTIAKVNNVRAFAMSKQYAFGFSANYYDAEMTYITLSGEARIDLINGIYEIKGLEIGNNTLNVVYADGVVYVDYADNKLKVKVENVLDVVKVVMPIVNANLGDADAEESTAEGSVKVDVDMAMELLSEACGEDVSAMTIEELVGKLTVELTGSLDNLGLGVILNTTNVIGANVGVEFAENELSKISVNVQDMVDLKLNVKEFEDIGVVASAYYDLTSKHSGQVTLTYTKDEEEKTLVADIDLDITNGVYVRIATVVMGETVEVVVSGAEAYLVIGEVVLAFDLKETKTLINEVMTLLGETQASTTMIETEQNGSLTLTLEVIGELLRTIDLNGIDPTSIAGLTWSLTDGEELSAEYTVNDNLTVSVKLSDEKSFNNVVPTANASVEDLLDKAFAVKGLLGQTQFAVKLDVNYGKFAVSGELYLDKEAKTIAIKEVMLGDSILNLFVVDNVAYIECGTEESGIQKIKAQISCVQDLIAIVMPIVNALPKTENNMAIDLEGMVVEIFGVNVLTMPIGELFEKILISISGSLDDLMANLLKLDAQNNMVETGTGVTIKFVDKDLSQVKVNLNESDYIDVKFIPFVAPSVENGDDYYDLTSSHVGSFNVNFEDGENKTTISGSLELDLTDKVYVKIATVVCEVSVQIVVLNNQVFVSLGTLCIRADLSEIDGIIEYVKTNFDIPEGETKAVMKLLEFIKSLDLNRFDPMAVEGLSWSADGQTASISYAFDKVSISATINDEQAMFVTELPQELEESEKENYKLITVPTASDDVFAILEKAKNVYDIYKNGIFETAFNAEYNGLQFVGKFKFDLNRNIFELADILAYSTDTNIKVFDEKIDIRIQNDPETMKQTLLLAFGNMKYKFPIEQTGEGGESVNIKDILTEITSSEFGVVIDFGIFEEVVFMLRDYSIQDYLSNVIASFARGFVADETDNITLTLAKRDSQYSSNLLTMVIDFSGNNIAGVSVGVYDLLSARFNDVKTDESTIEEYDASEFATYSDNFVKGIMNSLEVETGVYALSSEIAIRYSLNTFYGDLTAMLVEKFDEKGNAIGFAPRVQIHTTALGLNSYIYLIDNVIYIDIQGLQIKADLTETTIEVVLSFLEENFGLSLDESDEETTQVAEQEPDVVEPFRVILPALDKISGMWIENGLQINIEDSLQYMVDSTFHDMILQAFVTKFENTIIPTAFVFGANIIDPNTTIYDSYEEALLTKDNVVMEIPETQSLNFAVYLNNINVGRFISEELEKTFVSVDGYKTISALASNNDITNVSDYNTYKTVLDMAKAGYDWALASDDGNENAGEYKLQITGSILSDGKVASEGNAGVMVDVKNKMELGANVVLELGHLTEEEINDENVLKLFDTNYLKLQGNVDIQNYQDNVMQNKHLIDVFYQSNQAGAVYVTYASDNYADDADDGTDPKETNNIGKHALLAKIANGSLGSMVGLVTRFMNVELGEDLSTAIGVDENSCKTDFRYLQSLMGTESVDVEDGTSKVDNILSSVENMTALLYNMNLSKTLISGEGDNACYATTFTINLDKDFDASTVECSEGASVSAEDMATIQIVFKDEMSSSGDVKQKFKAIKLRNLVMGGSVMNFTVALGDFNTTSFEYDDVIASGNDIKTRLESHASKSFTYDINSTYTYDDGDGNQITKKRIDCTNLEQFADLAATTINQQSTTGESKVKNLYYSGSVDVNIVSMVGVNVGLNLYVELDESANPYILAQLDVDKSGLASLAIGSFKSRTSLLEFKDGQLTLVRKDVVTEWFQQKEKTYKWTYAGDEIAGNAMVIVKNALGLNSLAYGIIEKVIASIEANPTLERVLLDFRSDLNSGVYEIDINAENLMGMGGVDDMTLKLSSTNSYKVNVNHEELGTYTKVHKFIDGISTTLSVSGAVDIPLSINTTTGDYTFISISHDGVTYGGKTVKSNEYYRQQYLKSIGTII